MKKTAVLLFFILFTFTVIPAAFAAHADVNKVYDLEVRKVDEVDEAGHPAEGSAKGLAVLQLEFKADVGLGDRFREDTIDIYRTETGLDGSMKNLKKKKIGEINVEKDKYMPEETVFNSKEKTSVITYTDTVNANKKYQYMVSYGALIWQHDKSGIIRVMSKEESEKREEESGFSSDLKEYEKKATWPERLVASVLVAVPNFFTDIIGMEDPIELVFGVNLEKSSGDKSQAIVVGGDYNKISGSEKYLHTFSKDQFSAVVKYYEKISEFVPVSMVAIVVLLGLGLMFTSANPNSRLTFKDYLVGLLIAGLILKAGIYIISVVFDINYAVVKFFRYTVAGKLSSSFLDTLIMADSVTLGSAIVTCLAVFSVGILNWQYAVRQIILALLIGILPLIAVISVFPSRRLALGYWFREFFSQVFLQASHAAVLSIGILVLAETNNFWLKLACIMGLPVIAGLIRKIFDAEGGGSGAAGSIGAALGAGALLNVTRMLKPGNKENSKTGYSAAGGEVGQKSSFAGNTVGRGLKMTGSTAAGLASGIVTGGLTGNPSSGITGTVAGAKLGSGAADRVKEIGRGSKQMLFGSGEEKAKEMGLSDLMQLEDPAQAYNGAKHALGGGIAGTAAGSVYALGKSLGAGRSERKTAKKIKQNAKEAELSIPSAQQKVDDYKPVFEAAKVRYERARNLYSPNSSYMQGLKKKQERYYPKYQKAEQDYLNKRDKWNKYYEERYEKGDMSGDVAVAHEQLSKSKKKLDAVRRGKKALDNKIDSGKEELKSAQKDHEYKWAEYNQRQYEVNNLQVKLTGESIKEEFNKAKQENYQLGGSIDEETSWR
ncbi:MAG: hypothetical protein K9L17_08385 [Clostridiales bacterium]|nr:hypothetical protein [Clostridiales bacterium]MCF8022693.1 hypothetical protein [Clostridiales bacterium]